MTAAAKLGQLSRSWLRELGGEPTVIACGASALLVASHYQGATNSFATFFGKTFDGHPAFGALTHLYWFAASVLFYLVLPLVLSYATRGSFTRKYGFGLGDVKAGLTVSVLFLAVMLPTVYVVWRLGLFKGMYPLAGKAAYELSTPDKKTHVSLGLFAIYELGYVSYFVAWEFFFRGWMLNGLLPYFGRAGAVLFQVTPFVVMHFGKAEIEVFGSIVAGVALGILALRTRSFWYGAVVHAVVAVWMDVLSAHEYLVRS